jgi:hypothetical protein
MASRQQTTRDSEKHGWGNLWRTGWGRPDHWHRCTVEDMNKSTWPWTFGVMVDDFGTDLIAVGKERERLKNPEVVLSCWIRTAQWEHLSPRKTVF